MSQFCPVQPGRHSQKYPPIRFRQEWALMHGLSSHSLASVPKMTKEISMSVVLITIRQMHIQPNVLEELSVCVCVNGLWMHSSMKQRWGLMVVCNLNSSKADSVSTEIGFLNKHTLTQRKRGDAEAQRGVKKNRHSPMRHVFPLHCTGQMHLKASTRSTHTPLWLHGFGLQSSSSEEEEKPRVYLHHISRDFWRSELCFICMSYLSL